MTITQTQTHFNRTVQGLEENKQMLEKLIAKKSPMAKTYEVNIKAIQALIDCTVIVPDDSVSVDELTKQACDAWEFLRSYKAQLA